MLPLVCKYRACRSNRQADQQVTNKLVWSRLCKWLTKQSLLFQAPATQPQLGMQPAVTTEAGSPDQAAALAAQALHLQFDQSQLPDEDMFPTLSETSEQEEDVQVKTQHPSTPLKISVEQVKHVPATAVNHSVAC